jgi:hypothetical protein
MNKRIASLFLAAASLATGCANVERRTAQEAHDDFGVLVMAHGGDKTWNGEVEAALAPLRAEYPLEIAFGMADAKSLQDAAARLEAKNVDRIAVVRLFISGESWYERTEQILGLKPGAPAKPRDVAAPADGHGGHSMAFWRLETDATFALSRDGLMQADAMGGVLVERARGLSRDPRREDVLIFAHGPEDDGENARWIAQIDARADAVRQALPFRNVQVETLREDWPDKREAAQARIRAFVARAQRDGVRAIVIPYRVQGFGPYAKVLEGLDYASDGRGLVPHARVTEWVHQQAEMLRDGALREAVPSARVDTRP